MDGTPRIRIRYNHSHGAGTRPDHQGANETSAQSIGGLAARCPAAGTGAPPSGADALPAGTEPRLTETVADIVRAHRAKTMSPVETVERTFARIAAHDDPAMFISLRHEAEVIAEARRLMDEGHLDRPLYGVPIAVKDNIDVKGLPTTAACPAFSYQPAVDASAVARLRRAGAIMIGKSNLDQFATGLVGVRSPYGIPRNLFDARLIPGGSSSGSALAVAAGLVPLALGTDTAGSGRVPAALSNIVGLKPSLGLVSTAGLVPACRTARLRIGIRAHDR